MLNLVWPLSRLVGVLWGRLLPLYLHSPLPSPGRGMRDLEGLSTKISLGSEAVPGDGENCPPAWSTVFSLLTCGLINCFLLVSPACMHAPQCLCYSSTIWTTPASLVLEVGIKCSRESSVNDQTQFNMCETYIKWLITTCFWVTGTEKRNSVNVRISLHLLIAFVSALLC